MPVGTWGEVSTSAGKTCEGQQLPVYGKHLRNQGMVGIVAYHKMGMSQQFLLGQLSPNAILYLFYLQAITLHHPFNSEVLG